MLDSNQRHWLIISYIANESGMACSHHIDDRIAPLSNRGIIVTLLTTACITKIKTVRHLRIASLSPSGIRFELRHFLKKKKLSRAVFKLIETLMLLPLYPFYFIEKLIINVDTTWFWMLPALFRGYLHCLFHPQDLIYSTGGAVSAHVAAGFLAKLTRIKWIAEFQDPLIHSYCARSKLELKLLHWAEKYICANAGKVIYLTAGAKMSSSDRTGSLERCEVIYPGAKQPVYSMSAYTRSNRLRFVHFGSLGRSRNLEGFLAALESIYRERPELLESVRLSLYGSLEKNVLRQLASFPVPNTFEVHGFVPRHESVARMQESDVLLLIQNMDDISSQTIPSKVYEYFHARRPILGLVYRNNELADMLTDLCHIPVNVCDIKSVKSGIMQYIEMWKSHGIDLPTSSSPYTIDSAVDKLIMIAEYQP